MRQSRRSQSLIQVVVIAAAAVFFDVGQLAAQDIPVPQVTAYRVRLKGLEPFLVIEIENVGVDIVKEANRKPVPYRSKMRDIRLTKRFTKHKELHDWMHRAKNGQAERKDGAIELLDASGRTQLRINFVDAWMKSWSLVVPPLGEEGIVKERMTLAIRDFELVYD